MSASAELVCVPPDRVKEIWPHVLHLIAKAMERGRMGRFEDVQTDVLGGNAFLWLAIENGSVLASAVTKVTNEPGERLCTIVACGGYAFERWGRLIEGLEKYARAENCVAVEICGRPGWSRALKGYRTTKVIIRKGL